MILDFMNISLREENTEPLVMTRSLTICGSETTQNSWSPSHIE